MADEMLKRSWQLISIALGAQVFFLLAAGVFFYYRIGQAHEQITATDHTGSFDQLRQTLRRTFRSH